MRNIYTWVQAGSIDKKNFFRMLDNGYSPVICPGGVQEVLLLESNSECKTMMIRMMIIGMKNCLCVIVMKVNITDDNEKCSFA